MNRFSIKQKLLLYNIIIQCVILMVFSFSVYKILEISTLDKIESTLKVIVLDVVDDILEYKGPLSNRVFDEEKEYKFEPLYIRLIHNNSYDVINVTSNFPPNLHLNTTKFKELPEDVIDFQSSQSFIISRIKTQIHDTFYIIEVATYSDHLSATMNNLFYILLFIVPIILIFSIIGGYFLIYKSFLPIERMVKKLKNITAGSLGKRLETRNSNDEIDKLSYEINSLLTRLEIAFDKISQFSSDASHELKTPLTIIRGEIEVALRKERSSSDYVQTLKSCLDEVLLIQQTVDDLLFLAKNENDFTEAFNACYSDEIILDSIKELRSFAAIKHVSLKHKLQDNVVLNGHFTLLKVAVKNILKNAISFSHKNQEVIVTTYCNNEHFCIQITDFGIGMTPQDQTKIFEKFYRTDKSRNKESGGTGLGMSIVEKIIQLHHASIKLKSQENKGTCVTLSFKTFQGCQNEH
jgi:signal transduction histidine kinase